MKTQIETVLFYGCMLCALVSAGFATTPTNASLKGTYSFQLGGVSNNYWSASITCSNSQGTYTVTAGGSEVASKSIIGFISFDGLGNIKSGTYTQYGKFDQAASNATVVPSCTQGQSNNGYAVYDAPFTGTLTGTYTVQSNGTGGMTILPSGGSASIFSIELAGTAAIRTSLFMTGVKSNNSVELVGTAILY